MTASHHPLRVLSAGIDTTLVTSLCSTCPHGAKGCCVVPPRLALADIARIVRHGGRDWLLGELSAGRIVAKGTFMILTRPRGEACVYLGASGCTIGHERRPATCNFYVCESALTAGDDSAQSARHTRDRLEDTYGRWDAELAALLAARASSNGSPQPAQITQFSFDAGTLDYLAAELERLLL